MGSPCHSLTQTDGTLANTILDAGALDNLALYSDIRDLDVKYHRPLLAVDLGLDCDWTSTI